MAQERQNILVIKLGALGDFVQSLGPMRAIREHHTNANITLLTTRPFAQLAEQSRYFDHIQIDNRPKFYQFRVWRQLRRKLNDGKYDRVYDLQNNDRTSIYFRLFSSPRPEWVGVAKGASHRNTSPERTKGLAFYGHKQTLALAGIQNVEIDQLDWIETDHSHLELPEKYALIVPGCSPKHPEKRWPTKHFITMCNELIKQGITPIIIGTQDEAEITTNIANTCIGSINLTGQTTLFDIPVLGRNAICTIGNDTGPMHMIAPTGCKTIVLFSKNSNPVRHAPLGTNVTTLQQDNLNDLDPDEVLKVLNLN